MGWILTPGQERIRSLAKTLLHKFPNREYLHSTDHPVYYELLDALHHDDVVTTDRITSAPLSSPSISLNYLAWLDSISIPGGTMWGDHRVGFHAVKLQGSVGGDWGTAWNRPAYTGGFRKNTTMRAIFTIVAGQSVGTSNWRHVFYTRSQILYGDNGNHRLLGYVLAGETAIPELTFCDEQQDPDPSLNDALLCLEKLWINVQPVANKTRYTEFMLDVHSSTRRDADVARVQQFMAEASERERRVIAAYIHHRWHENKWWLNNEIAPVERERFDPVLARSHAAFLLRCLGELRAIEGRVFIDRVRLRFQRGIDAADPPSMFERWYEQQPRTSFPRLEAYS